MKVGNMTASNFPMKRSFHQTMPHDLAAERAVLGCALSGVKYMTLMQTHIEIEDFYEPIHQKIFEAIFNLYSQGRSIDSITVSEQLKKNGSLEQVGGLTYLNSLPEYVHFLSNASEYAKIVREKSILRKLILSMDEVMKACYDQEVSANTIIENASKRLYDIKQGEEKVGLVQLYRIIQEQLDEISNLEQFKKKNTHTGFLDLDAQLGGLKRGSLTILAARPAMGKSAFALNVGRNAAINKKTVAVFSLEMSSSEIAMRLFSSEAMVESKTIHNPKAHEQYLDQLSLALVRLNKDCKLYVDDQAGSSPVDIMSKCRRLKMTEGLDLVVIDYLQLMSGSRKNSENRQQEISEISRSLKLLAKELDVPVLALSQLSRACELRSDKRPLLSDLRESGSLEQDADAVLFLFRPEYYQLNQADEALTRSSGIEQAELIIAKNRGGSTGVIRLGWLPQFVRFVDLHEDGLEQNIPISSSYQEKSDKEMIETQLAQLKQEESSSMEDENWEHLLQEDVPIYQVEDDFFVEDENLDYE